MAKTDDSEACHRSLLNYLEIIKSELTRFETRLNAQKALCPIRNTTIDRIDQSLDKFVDCHRHYLLARKTKELTHFRKQIAEKESLQWLATFTLESDQVCLCRRFYCVMI